MSDSAIYDSPSSQDTLPNTEILITPQKIVQLKDEDPVERWRWDEKTVDYLPVALRY